VSALTVAAGLAAVERRGAALEARGRLTAEVPHLGREAFASSDACRACHPSQYDSWYRSFHRTMTQVVRPGVVQAPWDGIELASRGRRYRLFRRGEEHWAELPDPDWERAHRLAGRNVDFHPDPPRTERQVVMTTGSHHMQTFWVPSDSGREVYNLPFVYLFEAQRFVPREDVFLRPPQAGRLVGLWNNSCIECHTTAGRIGFDFEQEVFDSAVAEMGIACEACHGPAAEHVAANRNPLRRYWLRAGDREDSTIVQPARLAHDRATYVCGQCHGVWLAEDEERWLTEGHSFRPGDDLQATRFLVRPAARRDDPRLRELATRDPQALATRFWNDGMVRVSGREMSGMIESPCYEPGRMSCLSCHSLHDSSPDDQLAAGMTTNQACTQCHGDLAPAAALTAHTRHGAASSGSLCYNCHMPHTTYGLLKAIRSHHIDSPDVATTVATGRPNACNLCHLDQPLGWTADRLEEWFGQPRPALSPDQETRSAALLDLLTGDAGQRALAAWSMGWEPAREASGRRWLAPYLGHLLADPYATVRYIAGRSLSTLPGFEDLSADFLAPASLLARARDAAIRRYLQTPTPVDRNGPAILVDPRGELHWEELQRLSARRDDRPVFLAE
jgi:predicted CXXCH cytochrome family protein